MEEEGVQLILVPQILVVLVEGATTELEVLEVLLVRELREATGMPEPMHLVVGAVDVVVVELLEMVVVVVMEDRAYQQIS
jgi:hypothetical protein